MNLDFDIPDKLIPLITSKKRFNVIHGGRDSSKSHTIARLLIIKALSEKCLILCAREIQKSIKTSSYALLVKIIDDYDLRSLFRILEDKIICIKTGAEFQFEGLYRNIDNIKSKEGVKYCWVEEAKSVSFDSWRVLIPTLRTEGSQFYITYNPDNIDDPVHDMFVIHQHPEALVIQINYNENPFLSETSRKEIDYMREAKPDDYKWIYLGECRTTTEARILHNIVIHDFDIDVSRQPHFGQDHGFNDPNAITQSYIYDNELYICREYYKAGLDPEELKLELCNIDWLLRQNIIADSARPEIIKMLNSTGRFIISPARKSIGQPVREGAYKYSMALYLKQFRKIHIHETNCPNSAREFQRWSWQVDKNEKILDIVADGDDHTVDATIYALERDASIWYRNNFKR